MGMWVGKPTKLIEQLQDAIEADPDIEPSKVQLAIDQAHDAAKAQERGQSMPKWDASTWDDRDVETR